MGTPLEQDLLLDLIVNHLKIDRDFKEEAEVLAKMGDINKIMAVTLSRGAALVQVMAAVMVRVTGITNHTQGSTAEAAVTKIGKILNTTSMKNIHPRIGPEQTYRHYQHHQGFRTQRR